MKIMNWKEGVIAILGTIGAIMTSIFGGWDSALQTLIIFMVLDYISGLIVAGFFHASPKTKNGALESKVGWKGLCRKGGFAADCADCLSAGFACRHMLYPRRCRDCFYCK